MMSPTPEKIGKKIRELENKIIKLQEERKETKFITKRYERILGNISDCYFIISIAGIITDVSQVKNHGTHFNKQQLKGRFFNEVFTFTEKLDDLLSSIFQEGKIYDYEVLFINTDGIKNYGALNLTAIKDSNEKPLEIFATLRETNVTKMAENALIESEAKYRNLVERAEDGICIVTDGIFKFVNNEFARMINYSVKDLIGKPYSIAIPNSELPTIERSYQRILNGEKVPTIYQSKIKTKSNTTIDVEFNIGLIKYENKLSNLTVIRDIKARKQAEEMLLERYRYEKGLAACSRTLLSNPKDALLKTLKHLLDASKTCRVSIFENFKDPNDGLCMKQTYEVCRPELNPKTGNLLLKHLPYKRDFDRWEKLLSQNKPLVGLVEKLPQKEQFIFKQHNTLSFLALPIWVSREWQGFISFEDTLTNRKWTEEDIQLIRTVSEMIGIFKAHA